MKNVATLETYEPLTREQSVDELIPTSSQQAPSAAPFPRKSVLSVFVDLQDATDAAQSLRAAGFEKQTIHVYESHELLEAVVLDRSPFNLVTSIDYDTYLREARRGRFFLAIRPDSHAQLEQIRAQLAPHHAYLARYIDTWTVTELLP